MAAAGPSQPQAGAAAAATAAPTAAEESSDSEPEQEPGSPQKLIRKVSTSGQIRQKEIKGFTSLQHIAGVPNLFQPVGTFETLTQHGGHNHKMAIL